MTYGEDCVWYRARFVRTKFAGTPLSTLVVRVTVLDLVLLLRSFWKSLIPCIAYPHSLDYCVTTGRSEVGKVRVDKERRNSFSKTRRITKAEVDPQEKREEHVTARGSPSSRVRRDRILPVAVRSDPKMLENAADGSRQTPRRRSSKMNQKQLKVETHIDLCDEEKDSGTPLTEASTPSPVRSVRGETDLRSPGQRMTPKVLPAKLAALDAPLPDFITQTDKDGNAITPRSESAIQQARVEHPTGAKPKLHIDKDGKLTEEESERQIVDACAETLLDSIRIMCCCLLPPEESTATERSSSTQTELIEKPPEPLVERPSLLPKLHVDDHGKKCLVLDLDETLVHSSFRAVPGADFVIPVQVCPIRRPSCSVRPPNMSLITTFVFTL
jgi:hypothetical protein